MGSLEIGLCRLCIGLETVSSLEAHFSVLILVSVLRKMSRVVINLLYHHCGHKPVKSLCETFPG